MKILFDDQIFLSQKFGGPSRYFIELNKNLRRIGEKSFVISPIYINNYLKNSLLTRTITVNISSLPSNMQKLDTILKELKLKITDLWKSENIINIAAPLSIKVKYEYEHIEELSRLKNIFQKMNIIEKYSLEEFNINESYFKIYYYGSPKRLKIELSELGYHLRNDQGYWGIYKND